MKVAVIGAGAAGCFCAIALRRLLPDCIVVVHEAGPRPLRKVAVTGGGRCNLTNSFVGIGRLQEAYPRGWQLMKRALGAFSAADTQAWFEREGVRLVTQPDGCVFPRSQDAMEIVRTLLRLMERLGVEVRCGSRIDDVRTVDADAVVVTTGGGALRLLEGSGVALEPPVPSLVTFNHGDDPVRALAGTVVENASAALAGTKYRACGPLLVTDWGMSGPAILKLSSYGARYLAEQGYRAQLLVAWLGDAADAEVRERLEALFAENPRKQLSSVRPPELTARLWQHLLQKSGVRAELRCAEAGPRNLARLTEILQRDPYPVCGKSRFKEEFVTCGGVSLRDVNLQTLESKCRPGLYFAGEVLDVDAITGGFNLQAAWSTAMLAARGIASNTERP